MVIELLLPEEVMAGLSEEPYVERGPSEISVVLDVVGAVSNFVTVAGLLKSAPELARRLRTWVQGHPDEGVRQLLTIKGPNVNVELELPPNIPSQKIVDAIADALTPPSPGKSE